MISRRKPFVAFFLFLGAGCVAPETVRESRPASVARGNEIIKQLQQHTVERDSIRVTVALLPVRDFTGEEFSIRSMTRKDFEPILSDGYVNYADEENADLLSMYNIYKEFQADRIYDSWGNRLIPQRAGSWFADAEGNPRFTVLKVVIENKSSGKIRLEPFSSVLLTDQGDQVSAFSKEALIEDQQTFALDPFDVHPGAWAFWRQQYRKFGRSLDRAVLSTTTVFPRARLEGLVFFPPLDSDVSSFSFILPDVTRSSTEQSVSVDFEIEFSAK